MDINANNITPLPQTQIQPAAVTETGQAAAVSSINSNVKALITSAEEREQFIQNKLIPETKQQLDLVLGGTIDELIGPDLIKLAEELELKPPIKPGDPASKKIAALKTLRVKIKQLKSSEQPEKLQKLDLMEKRIEKVDKTLKKLSANLDQYYNPNIPLLKRPPVPTNFQDLLQDMFKGFEEDLQAIYATKGRSMADRVVGAVGITLSKDRDEDQILLGAALANLGVKMIDSYIENLKTRNQNNPFLKSMQKNEDLIKKELTNNFYSLALPDAKVELLKDSMWDFAEASLFRVGTYIAAITPTTHTVVTHTHTDTPALHADTVRGGAMETPTNETKTVTQINAPVAAESNVFGVAKFKQTQKSSLGTAVASIKVYNAQLKEIKDILAGGNLQPSTIKNLEEKVKKLEQDLEKSIKDASDPTVRFTKTAMQLFALGLAVKIASQTIKACKLDVSLVDKGAAEAAKELKHGVSDCSHQMMRGFEEVVNNLGIGDHFDEGIIDGLSKALDNMENLNSHLEKALSPILNYQGIIPTINFTNALNTVIMLGPPAQTIGTGLLAIAAMYKTKKALSKTQDISKQQELQLKGNTAIQIVMTPEANFNSVVNDMHKACSEMKARPNVKVDKTDEKAVKHHFAEIKSKINQCKNMEDFQNVLTDIQSMQTEKGKISKKLQAYAQAVRTERLSENVIPKDYLKQKKEELTELTEEAQQEALVDMYADSFKSQELYHHGMQLMLGSYLSEKKESAPPAVITTPNKTEEKTETVFIAQSANLEETELQAAEPFSAKKAVEGEKEKKIEKTKMKNLQSSIKFFKSLAKEKIDKDLGVEVDKMLSHLNAIESGSKTDVMKLYEHMFAWTLKNEYKLEDKQIDALMKFNAQAPLDVREKLETELMRILASKFKSSEHKLQFARLNLASSIMSTVQTSAQAGIMAASVGGALVLSNPVIAGSILGAGLAIGAFSAAAKYGEATLASSSHEQARVNDAAMSTINILNDPEIDRSLQEAGLDNETIKLTKEAFLTLAGIPVKDQQTCVAKMALELDGVSSSDLQQNLHSFNERVTSLR